MVQNATDNETAHFRQAFERSPLMQLVIDTDTGQVIDANDSALAFQGCTRERLRQLRLADLLAPTGDEAGRLAGDLLGDRTRRIHARQRDAEGRLRDVQIDAAPLDEFDEHRALHLLVHDISERVDAERRLRVYSEFHENLPVPLYRATRGATGRFIAFNPAFLRLFEADTPEQLFKHDISDLYVDPRERERFSNQLMHKGEVRRYDLRLRTLTGRMIECIDTAYRHEDENGQIVFDGVLEDVTHQRELERELARQAQYDDLSGLVNRRHCDARLSAEIERCKRYGQPLSVLMLDIDHFKRVNDEQGHAAGDRLLQEIAGVIRHQVRQTDLAARWGGEEFMVLLPSTHGSGAARLAEKLRHAVAEMARARGQGITVSIGCTEHVTGENRDDLLGRVDDALYAAKDGGRNRVCRAHVPQATTGRREGSGQRTAGD